MRPPVPIAAVHLLGLWTFYAWSLRRFFRFGLETVVGPVLSALLFLLVFAVAIGETQELAGGVTFMQFLVPGVAMFTLAHAAFANAAFPVVYDKLEGMMQDLLASPLAPWEIAAGYSLAAATAGLGIGAATLLAAWAFVPLPLPGPLVMLAFGAATALLFAMLGCIAGLWADKWDRLAVIDNFLMLPLAFLSGAFFTLESLPEAARTLIQLNPVFYLVDGARAGVLGLPGADPALSAAVALALLAAGATVTWRLFAIGYKIKP